MAARRARRTSWRSLVGAMAAAIVLFASAAPAVAAPRYFVEVRGWASRLRVDGYYQPLVGHFSGPTYDDILWFSPSAPDRIWSGGHHGTTADDVFTKPVLNVDMGGGYEPIVGDFSGDRRDDVFWSNQATGADVLWTTTAAHTFTASTVPHLPGAQTMLLADSDTGIGKDDLVRLGTGTGSGTLWVFPDAGTGVPTATPLPAHPSSGPFLAGDFDGNGAADLLATGSGSTPAEVWRRASGTATTFTTTSLGVTAGGTGLVGRFGKAVDERRDIVFLAGGTAPGGPFIQARATLWEARADGTFARSTIDLGTTSFAVTPVQGSSRDLLLMTHVGVDPLYAPSPKPPINGDTVWYETATGPVARATGNTPVLSVPSGALAGRFATSGRQDVFLYAPGTAPERLLVIR